VIACDDCLIRDEDTDLYSILPSMMANQAIAPIHKEQNQNDTGYNS
jgi:hypothetical protein